MDRTVVSRVRLVSWLIAAPAIAGAIGLAVIEAGGFMRPPARVGTVGSFAQALQEGGPDRAYAFVRAGHDPNEPIAFRDAALTGGLDITVSPLLLAVASNNENVVLMLLGFGVRTEAPGNRRAACLARRLGHDGLADTITRYGGPLPDVPCPDLPAALQPLLLPFLQPLP
ncbi:MAG TPA: hypothetical protein VIY56_19425 [Vicinamibacterales bacterium]